MPSQAMLFLLLMAAGAASGILNDAGLMDVTGGRCAWRVQRELDSIRRSASRTSSRAGSSGSSGAAVQAQAALDLAGYALHQPLRSAPYDMYVTGMRIRVPGPPGWVRVERCLFDPRNRTLDTRLVFSDLTVSGRVKLYELQSLDATRPAGSCSMTLRLRRAGLGFTASPASLPALSLSPAPSVGLAGSRDGRQGRQDAGPVDVRTNAHFVDPDFVSVYAHGCPSPTIEHRSDTLDLEPKDPVLWSGRHGREDGDLSREMEDVFLRGIRTLLARYMERRLQPALRDALMAGMGYSVSYGR